MRTNTKNSSRTQQKVESIVQNQNILKFYDILNSPELLDVMNDSITPFRMRIYDPIKTLSMFVSQSLSYGSSCRTVVNESCVAGLFENKNICSGTGAYCQARKKLPLDLLVNATRCIANLVEEQADSIWKWMNRSVYLADGTTVSMPDTKENQEKFPQHGSQKDGAGFPLCRIVVLTSLATGVLLNAAIAPYKGKGTGESTLLRSITPSLNAGDVLLGDAIFPSYFQLSTLKAQGVDGLFEKMGSMKVDFKKGKRLGLNDVLQTLSKPQRPKWMSVEEYRSYPDTLQVRFVKSKKKVLVTTMTNHKAVSKKALCELYVKRWNIELDLRDIKSTLGMDRLTCLTPDMIEKEIWSYFLGYNLIRLMMAQAASQSKVSPRNLSFKHALQLYLIWLTQVKTVPSLEELHRLFAIMAQQRVGKRPNRVEPRKVKRRPKPFARLRGSREEERKSLALN